MSRMTGVGRFIVLTALVYGLLFTGLITLNGGPLALAVPLLVYMMMAFIYRPPKVNLRIERSIGVEVAAQNTPVAITVKITNDGSHLDEALVEDQLPKGVHLVDGKTAVLTSLPAGGTLELRYTIRAPRGSYIFQDVKVSASDHLGVLREQVLLSARKRILYLPDITSLRKVAIRPTRTHGHFGPIPSRQAATGIDFYGLREYQMGDPRRWINWRASARYEQQLFVNQFEQERIADVGIILDARQQSNIVLENGESLFEYSVQAAGSLSEALLDDGNRVGLLIYGFGVERTFPGYGKVQQERILRTLGQAHTGHNFALESLGYLPTRFFPAHSQIVMVSPLLYSDVPAFTQLRATGYEVMVVSPDPVDFEARSLNMPDRLAWEVAQVERALLLRRLQHMGVRILDWPVSRPLGPLVQATLARVSPAWRVGLKGSV